MSRRILRACALGLAAGATALCGPAATGAEDGVPPPLARALAFNLAQPDLATPATLDSLLAAEQHLSPAARAGLWARRYAAAAGTEYRFGLADGGYVARGLLVPGLRHDCISLLYRTTELARARDARDAVALALAVRFAGADPDSVVDAEGRVLYDRPEHLDYSLDMIRSGHWGRDVTVHLAGAVPDSAGSARYAPGSFRYLPAGALAGAAPDLAEGDLVWFVLDPRHRQARALREEHGLVVGHAGILVREPDGVWLVHAASRPLPPWYDGDGVVKVPLAEYLRRVERYAGIIVTRLDED